MAHRLPKVVIVGRPNTGKSTLFNRIIGKRKSIEHHTPGVTRDCIRVNVEKYDKPFTLIDSGGLLVGDLFENEVTANVQAILKEAALVILLLDARGELTSADSFCADMVRRSGKPYLLVANKIDTPEKESLAFGFYGLGMGEPLMVSAAHNIGIGGLIEAICKVLPNPPSLPVQNNQLIIQPDTEKLSPIHVAILGRPNVGKSTLLNALIGRDMAIVSPHAGTTRDSIDIEHLYEGQNYIFIDTAGLRHKARVTDDIEYYTTTRTMQSLEQADVAILLIDATSTITEQDQRIAGLIKESGCACLVVVNKWDLIPDKDEHTMCVFEDEISGRLKFLRFVPFLFISAKTKQRVTNIYEKIINAYKNATQDIPTGPLNRVIEQAQLNKPAPSFKGKRLKIYYSVHTGNRPFVIACYVNNTQLVHFSYRRYLENRIRESFNLEGIPITLI
ncbi:MAG: ribosome biogenesis GTPase Der, partial [Candidatus Margulisiibacteriota bacterium]